MADTQPLAPTDDEIVALADATRTAEGGANGYILPISFARAVLAKWGSQPVVREPLTDEAARKQGETMTEPTELLPCPFCGGAPTTIERPDNSDGTQFFYAIACYCGRHSACAHKMAVRKTPEIAKADAVAAWNTRTPQPTQAQAGAVPLTDEQLWANDEIMSLNADLGWHMDTIRMFTRVIERAHGIGIKNGDSHGLKT